MRSVNRVQLVCRMAALWLVAAVFTALNVSADTYTWSTNTVGAAMDGPGAWNTTSTNWVGAGDVNVVWTNANGDTAAFGVGGAAGAVTVESGVTVGGLTFNAGGSGAYALNAGPIVLTNAPVIAVEKNSTINAALAGSAGFTKTGAATLTLSGANSFTGNVTISSGQINNTRRANNYNPTTSGLGDLTVEGRRVDIESGATLVLDGNDALGAYQYKTPVLISVDGGTLRNGDNNFTSIGDVELKNAADFVTDSGANVTFQTFNLRGAISVSGSSGSTISTIDTVRNGLHLGGTTIPATTFDVADTGDPVADLKVSAPLLDEVYNKGALIKSGAGVMTLSAVNTYSGHTTVEEGTLRLGGMGRANLALHLDASDFSTLAANSDGTGAVVADGPVGFWDDLSSSDLPALQVTANRCPIYRSSVAEFNGMPALEFDGSNDKLVSLLDINKSNIPNMTVVILYRKVDVTISGGLWGHDDGAFDRFQVLDITSEGNNNIATSGAMVNVKGMNNTNVLIYAATLKNGVAGGSSVHINGLLDGSNGLTFTSSEGAGESKITLGCIGDDKPDYYGNIQIAEVMVFDTALTDPERVQVENNLRAKWLGLDPVASDPILPSESIPALEGDLLDDLALHLDASDLASLATNLDGTGSVSAGSPVAYWGDISTNDLPATQANGDQCPTYLPSSSLLNNMPVLEFDGSNDEITSLLDINASQIPNITVMIAFRKKSIKVGGGLWGHDNGQWDRLQLLDWRSVGENNIAGFGTSVRVNGMNHTNGMIYAATLTNGNNTASSVHIDGIANSVKGLTGLRSQEANAGEQSVTFGNIGINDGLRGHIQIGEILIYRTALSDAKRGEIEKYLSAKWLSAGMGIDTIVGAVAVEPGATLDLDGGAHTLSVVDNSGVISDGTLTVSAPITPAGGAIGSMALTDASLAGTLKVDASSDGSSDLLAVTGDTDLSGLALQISDLTQLSLSQVYTIVSATGDLTGSFDSTNLETNWEVVYDRTPGAGSAKISYRYPGTLILLQ